MKREYKVINRQTLKLLAITFMLIDHLWASLISGNQWMNYVGRMAFPIFAFQIVEGYIHTSNFKKYALRLFIFALVSEIPFNLFYSGSWFFPFYQNVMFTLLLGLLAIHFLDTYLKDRANKNPYLSFLKVLLCILLGFIGFTDYGALGVLMVISFYIFRDYKYGIIYQIISLFVINVFFFNGLFIPINILGITLEFPTQGFALLAFVFIGLYNGKKGRESNLSKYSFYIFYPLHMLILYILSTFML